MDNVLPYCPKTGWKLLGKLLNKVIDLILVCLLWGEGLYSVNAVLSCGHDWVFVCYQLLVFFYLPFYFPLWMAGLLVFIFSLVINVYSHFLENQAVVIGLLLTKGICSIACLSGFLETPPYWRQAVIFHAFPDADVFEEGVKVIGGCFRQVFDGGMDG